MNGTADSHLPYRKGCIRFSPNAPRIKYRRNLARHPRMARLYWNSPVQIWLAKEFIQPIMRTLAKCRHTG